MSLFVHNKKRRKKVTSKPKVRDNRSLYNKDDTKGPPLPVSRWVDGKIMMCVHPSTADYTSTTYDAQIAIPLNTVFDVESLLFKGKAIVRSVDLPSTDRKYFRGRNRKMDCTIQCEFKRKICFDRLYTGQIFEKAFRKLPAQYLIAGAVKIVTALAPSVRGDVNSKTPHMISPLASAAQVFQISRRGEELPLPQEPTEDLSLLDKKFSKMKFTQRKKYFHDLEHLKEYHFVPGFVYTISCYTHMLSPSAYAVHMLGMKWPIAQYLNSAMLIAVVVLPESAVDDDEKQKEKGDESGISKESENGIEIIGSEELECESKEDDEDVYDFSAGNEGDFSKCEFLYNFQLWHTKLVDDLWPNLKKKHKKSHSMF